MERCTEQERWVRLLPPVHHQPRAVGWNQLSLMVVCSQESMAQPSYCWIMVCLMAECYQQLVFHINHLFLGCQQVGWLLKRCPYSGEIIGEMLLRRLKRLRLVAICQFYRLLELANKLQQTCQFHQVATSLLKSIACCNLSFQTCYNLLKQLAASLWMTSFDNQLATSLLTTCNRLVVNKLSQAMRTHPYIVLSVRSLSTDLLPLAHF